MAETRKAVAKLFEVNPEAIGRSWDQTPSGGKVAGRAGKDIRGGTLRDVLQQALENPQATGGDRTKYITDVAALLRQYVFSDSLSKRIEARRAYADLSPEARQQVDALIVAAHPNPRAKQGLAESARELLEGLQGKPLSDERRAAIEAASQFEGFSADQRQPDAPFSREAPAELPPPGQEQLYDRAALTREAQAQGLKTSAQVGAFVKKRIKEIKAEKAQKAADEQGLLVDSRPETRPRFRGGPESISAPEGGLSAPTPSPEQMDALRQQLPAIYEAQRAALRKRLSAATATRDGKGVRQRVELPEFSEQDPNAIQASLISDRDAKRAAKMQEVLEQTQDLEGLSNDEVARAIGIDDASGRKNFPGLQRYREWVVNTQLPDYRTNPALLAQEVDRRLQIAKYRSNPEGVDQAVDRILPPLSSMTAEDIDDLIRKFYQKTYEEESFGRTRSSDPRKWSIPRDDSAALAAADKLKRGERLSDGEKRALAGSEPNSNMTRRDLGETAPLATYAKNFVSVVGFDPWMLPDEFNSMASRGRPSTRPGNIVGLGGKQPQAGGFDVADDSSVIDDIGGLKSEIKENQLEARPLQGKPGRAPSSERIKGLGKRAVEHLYTEMLRAAGVERSIRDAGGSFQDVQSAFLKPPARYGFKKPKEMAEFAIAVLDADKPIPAEMRDSVLDSLTRQFEATWGSDMGLSSLPKAEGKQVARSTSVDDMRARLLGQAGAARPAVQGAPAAPRSPSLSSFDPEQRAEELAKKFESLPEEVETIEGALPSQPEGFQGAQQPFTPSPKPDARSPLREWQRFGDQPYTTAVDSRDAAGWPMSDALLLGQDPNALGMADEMDEIRRKLFAQQSPAPKAPPQAAPQKPAPTQVGQDDAPVLQPGSTTDDVNAALNAASSGELEGPPEGTFTEQGRQRLTGKQAAKQQAKVQPGQATQVAPKPSGRVPVPGNDKKLEDYVKDSRTYTNHLANAPEDSKSFRSALGQLEEMRRQGAKIPNTPEAQVYANWWQSEVIGPMEAALNKRFPNGVPARSGPSAPGAPIDPLESASTTPVGTPADTPSVGAAGASAPSPTVTPDPAATPAPATPAPDSGFTQPPRPVTADQMARGVRAFRGRNGRNPTPAEMRQIEQALQVGTMGDPAIKPWTDKINDFSTTALDDQRAARRSQQEMEIDAFMRQRRNQPVLDDLPLPERSGRSANPGQVVQDAEQAAANVDAAKATKDVESDKAVAVATDAARTADAESAAKKTEDAANAQTNPQPQRAGESGKPGLLSREWERLKREELDYFAKLPFRAGYSAIGAGVNQLWRNKLALTAAGAGLYAASANRENLPEWMLPVADAGDKMRELPGRAYDAAKAAARRILPDGGNGSGPGGTPGGMPGGAGIFPVGLSEDGPFPGDEGINMVPPEMMVPAEYDTNDSLDRIRRIISTTRPGGRIPTGTMQRPTTYY